MKKVIQILFILITISGYSQNNAPIAINDTVYVESNDSLVIQQLYGWLNPSGSISEYDDNGNFSATVVSYSLLSNDIDPDGDLLYIDTAYYSGGGDFNLSKDTLSQTSILARINYKPMLNFWGIDSALIVIVDGGNPSLKDTSTLYFFVKHKRMEQLNLNNINASVSNDLLFGKFRLNYYTNNIQGFEVPQGSNQHTFSGAFLWIGGKNQDTIYTNANTITTFSNKTIGNSGPIMDSNEYLSRYDFDWDRVWKINASDINYHISNWNITGYQPIEVIANWPAHGDNTKGQAFYLAPFIDNNGDGVYNPFDGDYPKIKGQQAIYFIYNNERDRGSNTSNENMKTEVHGMAYAYNCPSDSAIFNTVFLDYTVYNRSNLTFDSTIIGFMTNMDIGIGLDDYMGCDVERNSFYGYNGDNFDESDSANSIIGYGNNLPMQSVTFLKGAKQDNDGIDNPFGIGLNESINGLGFGDGIIDNEYWGLERFKGYPSGCGFAGCWGMPSSRYDFFNYLNGKWDDGSKTVWGGNGNGAATGGTIPAKYLFPSTSDPLWYGTNGVVTTPTNWTEFGEGNPSGDRGGLGTTGPFTFEPDSSISVTIALTFAQDYQNTGQLVALPILQERIDSIRSYFSTGFVSVCGGVLSVNDINEQENSLLVYPNPFNNGLTINYKLQNKTTVLEIYNLIGEKIITQTITEGATVINLTTQPKGIYFVSVIDGNNRISRKIIKQ